MLAIASEGQTRLPSTAATHADLAASSGFRIWEKLRARLTWRDSGKGWAVRLLSLNEILDSKLTACLKMT